MLEEHDTLVPPWYNHPPPKETAILFSTFLWGATICFAICLSAKAVRQTYRSWTRAHKVTAYITMVWLEWSTSIVVSVVNWLFLMNRIRASFWFFFCMLCMWVIQIQCFMLIMTNRIALIMYSHDRAVKLKWIVALFIAIINVSVFCIWIPARLEINDTYIRINNVWDRIEKALLLLLDLALNWYFMWLIKSKLVSAGLIKYKLVYQYNIFMVVISISLDFLIIGTMSLPNPTLYIQMHGFAFLVKLYIEMNIAELLAKIIQRSRGQHRIPSEVCRDWRPESEIFNRDWHHSGSIRRVPSSYGGSGHIPIPSNAILHESRYGGIYGASLAATEDDADEEPVISPNSTRKEKDPEAPEPNQSVRRGSSASTSLDPTDYHYYTRHDRSEPDGSIAEAYNEV